MGTTLHCLLLVSISLLLSETSLAQRTAELKCLEYRNQTIRTARVISLIVNPTPQVVHSFDCSKTVDLIVGGTAAKPGEFPHQALLGYPSKNNPRKYAFDCGGSLISKNYVLTAAHCFKRGKPTIVRLAEHSLQNRWDGQLDIQIDSITLHPEFNFTRPYHDIALVKLKDEELTKFTKFTRPACLWTGSELNVTKVIASGFGYTETSGNQPDVLQKVELDIMDQSVCSQKFRFLRGFSRGGLLDSQLCIGSLVRGKDTCYGDSGGPVQVLTEPKSCIYHVVGVTSTSAGGCGDDRPAAIYTKVSSYIDWIEGIVWE